MAASLSSFTFGEHHSGFDQGVISPVQSYFTGANNLFAVFPGGACIGALAAFYPTERWGRRWTLITNCFVSILGSLVVMKNIGRVSNDLGIAVFGIGRLISGVASGVSSFLVPLYSTCYAVKELTLDKNFGTLGSIHQIMITLGITVAYSLGLLCYEDTTHKDSWAIVLVPVLVSLLEAYTFIRHLDYESPTFLWMEGKRQEVHVIHRIHSIQASQSASEDESESRQTTHNPSFRELVINRKHNRPLLIACGLSLLQQFVGVNLIIMDVNSIFQFHDKGMSGGVLVLAVGVANTLSAVVTLSFMDSEWYPGIGRKALLEIGGVGMCLSMMALGFSSDGMSWDKNVAVPAVMIYICFFEISIGTIQCLIIRWFYNAELLPARGVAVATAMNWFGNSIIGVVTSTINNSVREEQALAFYFGLVCLLVCVTQLLFYARYCMIETMGKTPDEIGQLLGDSPKPQEEESDTS